MSQNFEQTYLQLRRAVLEKRFSRMNDKQREAVFQTEGPVLILAGAGSGKTTVVVNRIANMVQFGNAYHSDYVPAWVGEEDLAFLQDWLDDKLDDGDITRERLTRIVADRPVRPWNILAITFTNKAAGELKERLEAMLGEQALDIQASTFHSACMRILRREITALGYERSFTVYDTDDSVRIIKEALKELAIQEKVMAPKGILASISAAKDQLLSPEDVLREANGDYRQEVVGKVYSYYQKRLKAANALDFDDIIIFTVKIFQQYPDVLEKYRNRFRYIMVDEYQDTNNSQFLLVSLLAGGHQNICVVGDDDQSIYKFRGATIEKQHPAQGQDAVDPEPEGDTGQGLPRAQRAGRGALYRRHHFGQRGKGTEICRPRHPLPDECPIQHHRECADPLRHRLPHHRRPALL